MTNNEFQDNLNELAKAFEQAKQTSERDSDAFWDSLTREQKELAFIAVIRKIYKAEVEHQGSYRYALYEVFGFDEGMYAIAQMHGYLDLHNFIQSGVEEDHSGFGKKF